MNYIYLLISIAVVGFIVSLIIEIDMPPVFKNIIVGVAALAVILYVLNFFGLDIGPIRIHR